MKETVVRSLSELERFAAELLNEFGQNDGPTVLALRGNLGSGKTAFTKTLGKSLGVREEIVSPTFMLMRTYETSHPVWKKLVHIDAYRFEEEKEAHVLRLPELLKEKDALIAIEWPERIESMLPRNTYTLSFDIEEGERRRIRYGKS
jgi:tRNA threonylcarbamoyladenosine biosynthesis protein TsaE